MTLTSALHTAIEAALEAGRAIMDIYGTPFTVDHKADDSPLTQADRASHQIIVRHLQKTGIPVLSEEGADIPYAQRKDWETLWIVDPLDGTKEFIKGNGEFTVNIALIQDRLPVLGVISVPDRQTVYMASSEHGSLRCTGVDVHAGAHTSPSALLQEAEALPLPRPQSAPYTVVGSRSHATPELQSFVEAKRRELGDVEFVSAGSSLKFCLVAAGQADIYPRCGPTMEWDTAAGQAIAQAAGRNVRVWDSSAPLIYNKEDLHNPWFVVE